MTYQSGNSLAIMLGLCAAALANGCAGTGDRPRHRVGSLPFPGAFTVYAQADPQSLGTHRYGLILSGDVGEWETQRGILYTRRAGFLDVAHIRYAADWCRYCYEQILPAVSTASAPITIDGGSFTRYTIRLQYPDDWLTLSPAHRLHIADELSIQIAQQVAYDMCTWHEIITWFGYKSTIVIPEDASAFTYDDITAHAVGVQVAGAALRNRTVDFDDAMTEALDARLLELEVVNKDDAAAAVDAVREKWWKNGAPLKRYFDHGYDDGVIMPWIVPGFESDAGCEPLQLPSMRVGLYDFRPSVRVELTTSILEKSKILDAVGPDGEPIIVREHFPLLIEHIRRAESSADTDGNVQPTDAETVADRGIRTPPAADSPTAPTPR